MRAVFKIAVVLSLCVVADALWSTCTSDGWTNLQAVTLGPFRPFGALFDSTGQGPPNHIYVKLECAEGERVQITSIRAYTPGPSGLFQKAHLSKFTVKTHDAMTKNEVSGATVHYKSCISVSESSISPSSSNKVNVRFECDNLRNNCDVQYEVTHTCGDNQRPDDAENVVEEDPVAQPVQAWDNPACPVFLQVRKACNDATGKCTMAAVSDEDIAAVCNEYRTSTSCKAAATDVEDVKNAYELYCAKLEAEKSEAEFEGKSCPEFRRAKKACQDQYGDDCEVDLVETVCTEAKTVTDCFQELELFPYMLDIFESYCPDREKIVSHPKKGLVNAGSVFGQSLLLQLFVVPLALGF